tara:strand:+ start:421 stop:657 length:237 start_codon:yes stop_codon:yes gene_type:complete
MNPERLTADQHDKINKLFDQLAVSLQIKPQEALWSVMLGQSVAAIKSLGVAEANRSITEMLESAFEVAADETGDPSRN